VNPNQNFIVFPAILFALSLSSCTLAGPSSDEIKSAFQSNLPNYLAVEKIDLESTSKSGTIFNQTFRSRFKSTLKVTEITFNTVSKPDSIYLKNISHLIFIDSARKKDERVNLTGLVVSNTQSNSWKIVFQYDSDPNIIFGKPRSSFGSNTILIRSHEETDLISEMKSKEELKKLSDFSIADSLKPLFTSDNMHKRAKEDHKILSETGSILCKYNKSCIKFDR
jgi:hypothetical protein